VAKEVRRALAIKRTKIRQRVIARLSREEEARLITHAYRMKGERGLLIKTLFQTGARVSEFVNIKVEDVFFEEQMILIAKAKGGKSRYVVWSKNSCGFAGVVFQEPPEPFTTLHRALALCVLADRRQEQDIALALMISLVMIVLHLLL